MLKLGGRLEGDHVTHFWCWIKWAVARNLIWKCSYVDNTIEGGLMMCMSFAMDGNIHEMKWLVVEHKALKWVRVNNAFPKGSPWRVPMVDGIIVTSNWGHLSHLPREQPSWGGGPSCTLCHGLPLHNCF